MRVVSRGFADCCQKRHSSATSTHGPIASCGRLSKKAIDNESLSCPRRASEVLDIEMYQEDRAAQLRQDVEEGRVEESRVLTAPGG